MKNINQITAELKQTEEKLTGNEELKPAVYKRLKKRLPFLRHCIQYLESNPTKEFIEKQLSDTDNKISRRMNLFVVKDEEKLTKKQVSALRKKHEKDYDVKHLRDQVKALRFLLS